MITSNSCAIFVLFSFISEIQSTNLKELKNYRCRNGEYVSNELVCNGIDNCGGDRSDELSICEQRFCGVGKFMCAKGGTCMDITDYCNTIKDCSDGSDESNCGNEIEVNDCDFYKGKFLCNDKLKCLDLEYTCDGHCNCFDCSDENDNCSKTVDHACNACPRECFTTPYGPRCFCHQRDDRLVNLCNKVRNCSSDSKYFCPQYCSRYNKKITCSCYKHYRDITNIKNAWCRTTESDGDLLIYTTPTRIKSMNLKTKELNVIENQVECAVLTAAHDYVYYTNYRDDSRRIYNTSIFSNQTTEVLYWYSPVTSIAVDYITNNLYFSTETLMFYTRRTPRGNKKYIFKSNMDGTEEKIVIDGVFDDIASLTVDEPAERLYWLEKQKKKIHSVPFSSEFNTEIRSLEHEGDNSTSSITVFQRKVFFVKNHSNMITSMENFQDFILFYMDLSTLSIELLYAYDRFLQRKDQVVNPCTAISCPNSDNSNICLLRSSPSSNNLEHNCTRNEN